MSSKPDPETRRRALAAMGKARLHLLGLQHPEGWWEGEVETNVTMEAEELLLRQFLGIRTEQQTRDTARWVRGRQRCDGTWATYHGGPPDLSTTIEGYLTLRLADDRTDEPHMQRAAAYIKRSGGIGRARVFTKFWLAMFGQWPWSDVPALPPEIIFLPSWCPLNIYDWAYWVRGTMVPLSVVSTLRPVRDLPFDLAELHADATAPAPTPVRVPLVRVLTAAPFLLADKLLHRYHRRPLRRLRHAALRRAEEWVLARQEKDGCWGGVQPSWMYSIIALTLLGYPLKHPVIDRALAGLERYTLDDERGRRFQSCTSPVWDTVLSVNALADSGLAPEHPALARAAQWIIDEQVHTPGDWQVRRPGLTPGGWSFEFDNDIYPDTDDTAEALLALARTAHPGASAAITAGLAWMKGMASRSGAFAAFDVDNGNSLCSLVPFFDFGALTDPPTADVTAHVLEALAAHGEGEGPAARRARDWLLAAQEPSGSWYGRWGVNHLYGTGSVVPALIKAGVPTHHPSIERAAAWLRRQQNSDGGWGEDPRSYTDRTKIGSGPSVPSQTAWALLALLAADGDADRGAVDRGIDWLLRHQRQDGAWDEEEFTGTGFPGDLYLRYDLHRLIFPLTALARYAHRPAPDTRAVAAREESPAHERTRSQAQPADPAVAAELGP